MQPVQSLFYTPAGSVRSAWNRHISAATCARVKLKVVADKGVRYILLHWPARFKYHDEKPQMFVPG